jgi:hypothetical protein
MCADARYCVGGEPQMWVFVADTARGADSEGETLHRVRHAGVKLGITIRPQSNAYRKLLAHMQLRWNGDKPVLGRDQLLQLWLS